MSAMTRTRATEEDVPTDAMRDYYVQRASAGLIVTECTQVSTQAHGIHPPPIRRCCRSIETATMTAPPVTIVARNEVGKARHA
jgi:NADH:flavin oxidoreductase/NADH oxidase family protein